MDSACLRHTEIPHTSRLFSDFLYHYDRVQRFYGGGDPPPFPDDRRTALVAALRAQNRPTEALERLARPGTVAVVTGQQVGLFSGPAYTLYKALTAIKLARQMTDSGTPAVPVFWLATEDHDFAEVNHTWVFDPSHRPVQIQVDGHIGTGAPAGEIMPSEWPIDSLASALEGFPFSDEVIELTRGAYAPGASMGSAFRALVDRLLGEHELVFLDPMQPAIRELAAPLVRRAVEAGPELARLLLERNRALEAAGYHAQVHFEAGTSLVFLLDGGRRIGLKRQNGSYVSDVGRIPAEELAERADHLSPNALLRPVVQDHLLPTAVYVGGPAELAYLAQSQVIYEQLLGYAPRPMPRSGFTLFDARTAKLMSRYHLHVRDFFHGEERLRERIAHELMPADLQDQFAATRSAAEERLDVLTGSLERFDSTLAAAMKKSRAKMLYQLTKVEAKVARETMRRDRRAVDEAAYLYGGVYPHRHLQERFYSILPFVARHGLDLVERVYENVRLDCPDHVLLPV